jgi:hypothetical protein
MFYSENQNVPCHKVIKMYESHCLLYFRYLRNNAKTQSIYRKVAPGRLFTFKFLLFSKDIENCNPSQWRHSFVWFTRWRHFSVHPDVVIVFFNSFFPAFWKFESDITHGSTFLYILWQKHTLLRLVLKYLVSSCTYLKKHTNWKVSSSPHSQGKDWVQLFSSPFQKLFWSAWHLIRINHALPADTAVCACYVCLSDIGNGKKIHVMITVESRKIFIPNDHEIYLMAIKCSKLWSTIPNGHKIYQHSSF